MNEKRTAAIALGLTVLIIGGCSTSPEKTPEEQSTVTAEEVEVTDVSIQAADAGTAGAMTEGAAGGRDWAGGPLEDPDSLLYTQTVYFAFDSSEVDAKYHDLVAAHAEYLASNPSLTVRVEGHGDERGSREYNIGLGERRANAVRRLLEAGGVAQGQLVIVSYGEERLAASGQHEEAWALNRRVELVY
jgi:peptidoglycan-associated lipoprotein